MKLTDWCPELQELENLLFEEWFNSMYEKEIREFVRRVEELVECSSRRRHGV